MRYFGGKARISKPLAEFLNGESGGEVIAGTAVVIDLTPYKLGTVQTGRWVK